MMRSDAKLGLALGMLVIGFTVAFCFPREGRITLSEQVAASEVNQVNQEIEFIPIRDLTGIPPQLDELTNSESGDHLDSSSRTDSNLSVFSYTELQESETQESIIPESNADLSLKSLIAEGGTTETRVEESPPPSDHPEVTSAEGKQIYIVQANDTLSGISLKTLGSYGRYRDIYAANQHQLKSPDDLRIGMKLIIPVPKVENTSPDVAVGNLSPEHQEEVTPRKFSSPTRTPFVTDRGRELPLQQLPEQPARIHTIQLGDSLEGIALRYFGTRRAVQELQRLNPQLTEHPRQLKPGSILKLSQ